MSKSELTEMVELVKSSDNPMVKMYLKLIDAEVKKANFSMAEGVHFMSLVTLAMMEESPKQGTELFQKSIKLSHALGTSADEELMMVANVLPILFLDACQESLQQQVDAEALKKKAEEVANQCIRQQTQPPTKPSLSAINLDDMSEDEIIALAKSLGVEV